MERIQVAYSTPWWWMDLNIVPVITYLWMLQVRVFEQPCFVFLTAAWHWDTLEFDVRALWVKQLRQSRKWSRRTDFTSFWCKCHFSVLPKNIRPSTNLVFSISGTQTWWLIIIVRSRSLIYDGDYWHDFAETVFCTSSLDLSGYSDQDHPVRR